MQASFMPLVAFLLLLFLPLQGPFPDLTILEVDATGISTDCSTLSAAGTVSATVKNIGEATTDADFTVIFYDDRNGNGQFETGIDLMLGEALVTEPLDPGDETQVSSPVDATVSFAGDLIYAFADIDNVVPEQDESNNVNDSGRTCEFRPPVGSFQPVVEWAWTASEVLPDYLNVMSVPGVADLNADGVPDVVFGATNETGGPLVLTGVLRALSGADGSELFTVTDPSYLVNTAASVAVGDIDLDGRPEILASDDTGARVIAFEHDGAFKWRSPVLEAINWGAPALADLDADGVPEIVVGRQVLLSVDGSLLWTGTQSRGGSEAGPLSLVADINLDGSPEVMAGNTAYTASGTVLWHTAMGADAPILDGYNAVGNFDDDPFAEAVLVFSGKIVLLEHNGEVKWGPFAIPGGGSGGPPTVDDFDNDGQVEIGVAGLSRYSVFETDGSVKWSNVTQDSSSSKTGSSIFDFEADGLAEVIYSDELTLRVYRGGDGAVLFQTPLSSCTWHEFPVVADVDADGNAEIVAAANNNCGFGPQRGVFVYGDALDHWVSTRRIWNQHTYHITNVREDTSIPAVEPNNWLEPGLNNFRAQVTEGNPFAAPNLTASFVRVDDSFCPEGVGLRARLGNGGANVAAAPINVAFYDGDPDAGGILLGVTPSTSDLNPGEFEDVLLEVSPPLDGPHTICAVADDNGSGVGFVNECNESDNKCCTEIDSFCNNPPELTCLSPEVCNDPGQCRAGLDCEGGVASCSDPDGDATTLTCDPTSPYSVGTTDVSVMCDDGRGGTDSGECTVIVNDCEKPTCSAPKKKTFECTEKGGIARNNPAIQAWLASARSTDNCGVDRFTNNAPDFFPLGTTTVTWTAVDESGNTSQCSSGVVVGDTTPPVIDLNINACCLWPPNHKFVQVGTYTVRDVCDPNAGKSAAVAITTDEHPAFELGAGGPEHCPDARAEGGVISLRAERAGPSGKDNGRVYGSITVSATDKSGNKGKKTLTRSSCPGCPGAVCVPHDQNPKSPGQSPGNREGGMCLAVDDGQRYDAQVCK